MANISREDDLKDYNERMANNGNRLHVFFDRKTQKELIEESEREYIQAENNLKTFIRKHG